MTPQEELLKLRRLKELEAKAGGGGSGDAIVDQEMAEIRRLGGSQAAEGRPVTSEPPLERTQLPQDQRSPAGIGQPTGAPSHAQKQAATPSFRQGSVADVQFPAPAPAPNQDPRWGPNGPPPFQMETIPLRPILGVPLHGAQRLLEQYEERIAGPTRRAMFKRDPLEQLAETEPGPHAPVSAQIKHGAKVLGTGILADPLTALGAFTVPGRLTPGKGPVPIHSRTTDLPTPAPAVSVPAPAGPAPAVTPPVQAPPAPSVLELADQARTEQLLRSTATIPPQAPGPIPSGTFPPSGIQPMVEKLPTESVVRPLAHEQVPSTASPGPSLAWTPTGSLIRTIPEEITTAAPREPLLQQQPPLPALRQGPTEAATPIPESRPLHGRYVKPGFLESAEDRLAAQAPAQQKRFQEVVSQPSTPGGSATVSAVPDVPPLTVGRTGSLDEALAQPRQVGPRNSVGTVERSDRPTYTQQPVSSSRKLFLHAYDVLDRLGPYSRQLGDILRHSWDYSEAGTKQNFLDYAALVEKLFGPRELQTKLRLAREGSWSAVLNRTVRDYGLTQKQVDALVELHHVPDEILTPSRYTPANQQRLLDAVSPAARERLAAELLDPRIQQLALEGWKILTGRASNLPPIQQYARVTDPVRGTSIPVGPPSRYWPHQALTGETKTKLTTEHLKKIFFKGGYSEDMPWDVFETRMAGFLNNTEDDVLFRKYAGVEYKRLLDIPEDAKSHNRTMAESLRKYGYDTDPLRVLLKHNLYTLKRSVFLEHEQTIDDLMKQLRTEYGNGSKEYKWIQTVVQRSQGLSEREDIIHKTTNAWSLAQSIMYPAFLKGSWSQNFLLQPVHAYAMTGMKPVIQAATRHLGAKLGFKGAELDDLVARSAANWPSYMAKYHLPGGLAEQYSKTALLLDSFTPSDQITRSITAEIMRPHAEHLIRQWWKQPANPKWQRALQEGNLNPAELMQRMSAQGKETWDAQGMPPIPPEAIMRYVQTMTNKTMGRTGVRSLPLWMSGETDFHRVFMMLHRQVSSNEGVFWNTIVNAPTAGEGVKRALRYLVGAEAAGVMYQGLINWIVGNDFFDVNEPLAKSFGGNKQAAFAVKSLALGLGTLTSGLVLSGLNLHAGNYGGVTYGLISPPAAAFIDELAAKAAQGKFGQAALRLQPSETLDKWMRRKETERRRRESAPDSIQLAP